MEEQRHEEQVQAVHLGEGRFLQTVPVKARASAAAKAMTGRTPRRTAIRP
jgi:hypothetical protein